MASRRSKISYEIDTTVDLFVAPTWPDAFLKDPSYALFRPLYEYTSPWRLTYGALSKYLNGQARRMGGRQYVLYHFSQLAQITPNVEYPSLYAFLLDPFTASKHNLTDVFSDAEKFLRWRFECFTEDPWFDFPDSSAPISDNNDVTQLPTLKLSDTGRRKLLKKALSKIPWQQQLQRSLEYDTGVEGFHTALIENAIKECPDLLQQHSNQDLVQQIFSSSTAPMALEIGEKEYMVTQLPIMLGSHYLSKRAQKVWFDARGKKFYRILGCYARWDDAKVVIFKSALHNDTTRQKQMFSEIREQLLLVSVGVWKKLQVDGLDYYLSLLIDSDLPDKAFFVSEWEVNCQISLVKDTRND